MGIRVTERAKTIVVFLAGRIPQREFNVFSVNLYVRNIVLKDGGDVNLVESWIMGVGERGRTLILTSGNVPFEKTINRQV